MTLARTTTTLRVADNRRKPSPAKRLLRTVFFLVSPSLFMAPFSLMAQGSVQAPVNLGTAGNYVILSETGITDVPPSPVVGNIGSSPITGAAIHVSCAEVTGTISSVDAAGPAPCSLIVPGALGVAINDMTTAYTNAAGRTIPDFINLGAGNITGMNLVPGLYKWSTDLLVSAAGVTLSGGPNAVWIFQIAGDLNLANNARVVLAGGAQANNVFWQVGASSFGATLGTGSVMNGTILSAKQVIENTGATLVGRALAQTQVTLQSTSVTSPGTLINGIPPLVSACTAGITPTITAGGIVNAGSFTSGVAAGSIASVFGSNFGSTTVAATAYPLLSSLGATSFQVGLQAGPLFMISCSQTNLQIPWQSAGLAQVSVTATVGGLVSTPQTAAIAPFAPSIFTMNQTGSGQGAVVVVLTGQLAAPLAPGSVPVARGQFIAIFCTGLGPVSNQPATGAAALAVPLSITPASATVTIGGIAAQVTYSGLAPGFAGLYQVNALVPVSVTPGSAVSLVVDIGGVQSNIVTIAVQ